MNRDDIIRMSREATKEAPREDWNSTAWVFGDETLERFAALVASAEREACAKVCEEQMQGKSIWIEGARACSLAIRARDKHD